MLAPTLPPDDLLALSFVRGLPRAALYALLRGEEPSDIPRLPFDAAPQAIESLRAPAGDVSNGAAELGRSGPKIGRRIPNRDRRESRHALSEGTLEGVLDRLLCGRENRGTAQCARAEAERAARAASAKAIRVITWGDGEYPPLLAHLFDPPLALWVRGSADAITGMLVAVVGSRGASSYGEAAAARLSSDLAARGFTIVSGLARGIDAAAHRGALATRGRTVAVLGSGADVVYPPEHGALLDEVTRHGAVVSEYPPGTAPQKAHFPRRNRIISGLSVGVIVVEASAKSGALITADCALEQGRQVMAVPGNVLSERHRGSHTLLKSGAALVESAEDVLDALGLGRAGGAPVRRPAPPDPLLAILDEGEGCDLDMLAARLGLDAAVLLPRLLELELQGFVRRLTGGRFVRSMRTC